MRRVVVTGMGAITPIGLNVEDFWNSVKAGKHGFGEVTHFDTTEYKVHLAAEVKGFQGKDYMDPKSARRMELFCQYAVAAAKEAMADAGIDMEKEDPFRVGCSIGSGIGSLQVTEREHKKLLEKGPNRINPLMVPLMISNMAAGNVSIQLGLRGKNINVVTACATGTNSIGEAYRSIQCGEVDVMARMGANVNQRTAALLGLVGKHAPGGNAAAAQIGGLSVVDIAQPAVVHNLLGNLVHREVTVLIADGQHLAGAVPGVQHLLGVGGGGSHGLLAQHMLAGFQSGHSDLAVSHVGGQHMHSVNGGISQQVVIIRVNLGVRSAILLGGLLSALGDQVAESHHVHIFLLLGHAREVFAVGDAAATNKADLQFCHWDLLLISHAPEAHVITAHIL